MSSTKPFSTKIALVDCNNFFVSCERLFDPQLHRKPVVVLSSNDGCVIARSEEAKQLKIPMGAPLFQWKDFMKQHAVIMRSSNFTLYGDISNRVMETLYHFHPEVEMYSIDEAFLFFGEENPTDAFFHDLRAKILQWVGIPVSIGVSATKTLAKAAAKIAKKNKEGIYQISTQEQSFPILSKMPVGDVWGIGRSLTSFLHKKSIKSALDLIQKDDIWLRKNLSVTGLKTAWELRGISCLSYEEPTPKQSIMTSRSFGTPLESKESLLSALSYFASRGGEKLREEGRLASTLDVFIMTSPHKDNFFHDYAHITFPEPTDFTPALITAAQRGLEAIFRPGLTYKRGGILLGGLVGKEAVQIDLFAQISPIIKEKQKRLMALVDEINNKFSHETIYFGASKKDRKLWKARSMLLSPSYTTRWEDLLVIAN